MNYLYFIKSKINNLEFEQGAGVRKLKNICNVIKLSLQDQAHGRTPAFEPFEITSRNLLDAAAGMADYCDKQGFEHTKSIIQGILEGLLIEMKKDGRFYFYERDGEQLTKYNIHYEFEFSIAMYEQDNWEFFANKPSKVSNEKHDRVRNHRIIFSNTEFLISPTSDLPDDMKADILTMVSKFNA